MSCIQKTWIANFSFWVHLLNIQAFCYARNPPPGRFVFPDQKQDQFVKALQDCQVVSPERVDGYGHFLSYHLNHHASNFRGKRDSKRRDSKSYYKIRHKNKDLFFNLTLHQELLSNNYVLEKHYGSYLGAKILPRVATSCHLIGMVMDSDSRNGRAVISTCNGLTGYFHLPDGDYFIEPVKKYESKEGAHPHIIYKTNVIQKTLRKQRDTWTDKQRNCGVNGTHVLYILSKCVA
ncbi:A disintegrin and metalloproteinase with thrombospondin motifs 12-like [Crotalus tigris]|uniref:A disintegrin and metalloproteinase with thrombospondin motifs 12-like n=1 Tax=Crotalus tigris TaxID=88082 RepID=UPI00192F21A2|nr:A disintegrin and metalloproteinase with thrombospondin motifs 12-like [Crotalus tigris]